eukprot:TRINITY_DN9387_c0_g1::TRINITY_DN9387_c0_g1_i1::g.28359::m.28359 TRINITY_DN9387_c0_g1::TRINITY_DN9387_c0_g1_i1::g.28359  ORF type:complete len:220 (-),score=43.01,sp/E1BWM5/FUND1_CHICK/29.17/5e-11,FUN14/PF04930.10/8.4e+02,FUN14/PF04930.10/9.8e-21,EF-hand_1/PF00036.27/2.5e+03,EF-hand_1/PF00036.27/0.024,EF-hand_6/PF13405.1/3.6e+03,EF-hand_6/PF13405.1/0.088,EF-hand_5/PF13202.1/0.051,EF-hand_7/PF13499.1/0.051,DUF399/PF04187.8/0.13,EF-hand_8/PF13833.1/0.36 TRINITY_DN9387_c0_g1_i1:126-740(-)
MFRSSTRLLTLASRSTISRHHAPVTALTRLTPHASRRSWPSWSAASTGVLLAVTVANAEADPKEEIWKQVKSLTENATTSISNNLPPSLREYANHPAAIGGQLSLGACMGFASGFALKKVGKVALFSAGSVFLLFQLAAQSGYISINWEALERDFNKILDRNQDGKVDQDDLKILFAIVEGTASFQVPAAAGFAPMFYMGWRSG